MLSSDLPIDLLQLAEFVLADAVVQSLIHSATNSFFAPIDPAGKARRVGIRQEEGLCWRAVPEAWRDFFENAPRGERFELLKDLADCETRASFPSSLNDYIHSCRSLALDRRCSDVPILSRPLAKSSDVRRDAPPAPATEAPQPPLLPLWGKKRAPNAELAGLNAKKAHEVKQFAGIVGSLLRDSHPPTHVIDVGSGRAHLSRALAAPPLGLHVLALDWSESQLAGAERLDTIKAKASSPSPQAAGSLTHRISSLDAQGVAQVLQTWPPEGDAMLVGLHACGDLTVSALQAFVETSGSGSRSLTRKMVAVGCCYNLLTPETFPLSTLLASLPTPPLHLTREQLLITAQAPSTWHLSPASITSLASSISKLAYRSRFDAEIAAHALPPVKVGRIGDSLDYASYRAKALAKTGLREEDVSEVPFGEGEGEGEGDWEDAVGKLQFYWTLKSLPGPAMESFLLLDRFAFLVERLETEGKEAVGDSRRVELVNLFDQATGSLRNVAIVVR